MEVQGRQWQAATCDLRRLYTAGLRGQVPEFGAWPQILSHHVIVPCQFFAHVTIDKAW